MTENHKRFLKRLERSKAAVAAVADYLKRIGYEPTIATTQEAPSHSEWRKYRDNGDIFIWSGKKEGIGEKWRIEVKGLGYEFTSLSDWPHTPWFAVCAQHSFDEANPKPYAFFIVNASLTHTGIVFSSASNLWTVREWNDRGYTGDDSKSVSYFAPLKTVTWRKISAA